MIQRHFLAGFVFLFCIALPEIGQCASAELRTESTYEAAQQRARDEKRLVFIMFKHQECGTCRRFTQAVLDTDVFRNFAQQHLVVLIYDFATTEQLPAAERATFDKLRAEHRVEITPTIVVLDSANKKLFRTEGYADTPPEKIVAHLRTMVK